MLTMTAPREKPFEELGAMVARYREALEGAPTQKDIARAIKVTTSMMSKIEQGLTKPGVANANALDVELKTEGRAIFQAYYGQTGDDPMSMLRDEVAQLAQDLDELRREVDRLRRRR